MRSIIYLLEYKRAFRSLSLTGDTFKMCGILLREYRISFAMDEIKTSRLIVVDPIYKIYLLKHLI